MKYTLPISAIIIAIVITTVMDFTGFINFSALPLLGISLIFWWLLRLSKVEIGLVSGKIKYFGYALLYPLVVLGITSIIAYIIGDFSFDDTNFEKIAINIAVGSTIGIIMVLITEEGFFRGWLWGAFRKSGLDSTKTLYATTLAFMLWHISAVTSGTSYGLPMTQVPVYLTNVILIGMIWGLLRSISGSVLVPAVSHAVWNAFAYELFGFGEKTGALGIQNTALLGPEVGYLGILLNGLFCIWLWKVSKKHEPKINYTSDE
jgi:membrane protease YdiL (CAAX protease family)